MTDKQPFLRLREPFPKAKIQQIKQGPLTLDYVGHADITERLLEVDPGWTWEPVAFGPDGLPAFDNDGGLWIRLTVLGGTRNGYGEPRGRNTYDARKGAIGNALRNAAMRFGVALQLWQKDATESHGVWEVIEAKAKAAPAEKSEWTRPDRVNSNGGRPASEKQVGLVKQRFRLAGIHGEAEAAQALTKLLGREVAGWRDLYHADIDLVAKQTPEELKAAFFGSMGLEVITNPDPWAVPAEDMWAGEQTK